MSKAQRTYGGRCHSSVASMDKSLLSRNAMTNIKRIHLMQHLRHGDQKVKTRDLDLSLDEDEVDNYICRHNGSVQVKEDFELLSKEGKNMNTLAVLHTQGGFVCLEARSPNVYVPMLGLGFNGKSAHDFQVKVSGPGDMRYSLQLRPGEPFCVSDLSLTLVSEEHRDHYTQLASTGLVPSYDDYSQHVSQLEIEPQAPFTPSPARLTRLHAVMETPKRSAIASSPLARIETSAGYQSHTTDDETTSPTKVSIQHLDHSARKRRKLSPVHDIPVDECQIEAAGSPKKVKSIASENEDPLETPKAVSSIQVESHRKVRRTPPARGLTPKDESQDSLAGKVIKVTCTAETPNKASKPTTSSLNQASMVSSSHQTGKGLKTPSPIDSTQASGSNSLAPSSSTRSTRSAVPEGSNPMNIQDGGIRVLFSSNTAIGNSSTFKKFLKERGVKIVQNIKDATCFCVGKGELKKTTKFIMAVLKGVDIIREDWVTESARLKELQALDSFIAKDPTREHAWGTNLEEAVERGKQGVRVFLGWTIIITSSAKKDLGKTNFADFKDIAMSAGATNVTSTLPKADQDQPESIIIVGTPGDTSIPAVANRRCYTKDIISLSVLRGNLNIEMDEFLLHAKPKVNKKRKR